MAANLTVWKFEDPNGARKAADLLKGWQERALLRLDDAAIVTWPEGKKKPKTEQFNPTGWQGALGGGFWGMLFGLIFLVPLLGFAIGAAAGAVAGKLSDFGIDDDFINSVKSEVTEGTSALFILGEASAPDKIAADVKAAGLNPTLIESNLTVEQENNLKALFAED